MKRYLRNLLIALFGRDPYWLELENAREEYRLAASRVQRLEEAEEECQRRRAADEKLITSYQNLTENLRKRITEKDIELYHQATNCQEEFKRMRCIIKERDEKIDELREDLEKTLER